MKFLNVLTTLAVCAVLGQARPNKPETNMGQIIVDFLNSDKVQQKMAQGTQEQVDYVNQFMEQALPLLQQMTWLYSTFTEEYPGVSPPRSVVDILAPEYQYRLTRKIEFVFYSRSLPYFKAQNFCRQRNGILPELHTYEEIDYYRESINRRRRYPVEGSRNFEVTWLGYREKDHAQSLNQRHFVSEYAGFSELPFAWIYGEPNNLEEQCVSFTHTEYYKGHMQDVPCRESLSFACQFFKTQ